MTVQLRQNAASLTRNGAVPVMPAELGREEMTGGFARGTPILTATGEVPVETLRAGDRVVTRERGIAILKSVDVVNALGCPIPFGTMGPGRTSREIGNAAHECIAPCSLRKAQHSYAVRRDVAASGLVQIDKECRNPKDVVVRLDFGAPLTIHAGGIAAMTGSAQPARPYCRAI